MVVSALARGVGWMVVSALAREAVNPQQQQQRQMRLLVRAPAPQAGHIVVYSRLWPPGPSLQTVFTLAA